MAFIPQLSGPSHFLGRTASAETDATMRAEVLSYSRSRGVFAGISLTGSSLRADNDANESLYGKKVDAKDVALNGTMPIPACAQTLINVLTKHSPKNLQGQ